MALRPPNGEKGLIPVVLFPNRGFGFGFGETSEGVNESGGEPSRLPLGYDRTVNMTVRDGRVFSPSLEAQVTSYNEGAPSPPAFLVPWKTSADVPFVLFNVGSQVLRFQDGALTVETDDTTERYASGVLFVDNSDVAFLYCGTATGSKFLNDRTQGGTWVEDGDVVAILMVVAGGTLWATISEFQVRSLPAGNAPRTDADWSASPTEVGTNAHKITSLGAKGTSPVIGKEDGIYVYNEDQTRFENEYPVDPHPDNFPFMRPDGAGGLYTATADGSIVHITRFGGFQTFHPLRDKTPGRDTPHGPIKDIAVSGDKIFALMGNAYRLVSTSEVKVIKDDNANFSSPTDYSSEATDRSFATFVDLDGLGAGDYLGICFSEPFLAVRFVVKTANTTANSDWAIAHSTAQDTWSSEITAAVYEDGSNDDQQTLRANRRPLGQTGILRLEEQTDISDWAKATYGGHEGYWLRLRPTQAFSATVEVAEVAVIPRRGAPDFANTLSRNRQQEIWEASGMYPKILQGTRRGDTIFWDDIITLFDVSEATKIAVSELPSANSPTRSLVVVSQRKAHVIPLPLLTEPLLTEFPLLARDASARLVPILYPSPVNLGGPHELRYIECFGSNFVRETDDWQVASHWDDTPPWGEPQVLSDSYALFSFPSGNAGRILHPSISIKDGATTEPVGPSGYMVVAWVRPVEAPPSGDSRPARQVPEGS